MTTEACPRSPGTTEWPMVCFPALCNIESLLATMLRDKLRVFVFRLLLDVFGISKMLA